MNESFGQYIRKLRKSKGLTLTQLAAQLGLDAANLSKIENGKRDLDEKKIEKFCKIFELEKKDIEKELVSERIAKKLYKYESSIEILELAESKLEYLKKGKS